MAIPITFNKKLPIKVKNGYFTLNLNLSSSFLASSDGKPTKVRKTIGTEYSLKILSGPR